MHESQISDTKSTSQVVFQSSFLFAGSEEFSSPAASSGTDFSVYISLELQLLFPWTEGWGIKSDAAVLSHSGSLGLLICSHILWLSFFNRLTLLLYYEALGKVQLQIWLLSFFVCVLFCFLRGIGSSTRMSSRISVFMH